MIVLRAAQRRRVRPGMSSTKSADQHPLKVRRVVYLGLNWILMPLIEACGLGLGKI